jgi:hypothetical protein
MSERNWGFIAAALFGVVSFSGIAGYSIGILDHPKQQRYERYRHVPSDLDVTKTATADKAGAIEYREPCKNPEGQSESELCAQWKAAWAAETGTLWAARGFWASVLSIIGLGATILLTLKAVRAAGRATVVSEEQLSQMKHEARAWLSVTAEPQKIAVFEESVRFYYLIKVQNVGSTVAHDVDTRHSVFDAEDEGPVAKLMARWTSHSRNPLTAIMPGETVSANVWSLQARIGFRESASGGFIHPALLVYIRYSVTSDTEEHGTRRVFRFGTVAKETDAASSSEAPPVVPWISLSEKIIPAESLSLESFGAYAT